jgi:hypothetical protein
MMQARCWCDEIAPTTHEYQNEFGLNLRNPLKELDFDPFELIIIAPILLLGK